MVTLRCASTKSFSEPEIFGKYYDMLDEERRARVDGMKVLKNKFQLVAAGALLIREFGEGARFKKNESGKPYLVGNEKYFNLSHSGEIAILAVSHDEVGCDVQFNGKFNGIVGKLSASEKKMAAASSNKFDAAYAADNGVYEENIACSDMLRRIWAAKESYVKALGVGLRRPLDSYTARILDDMPHVDDPETGKRYYLKEYNLKDYFDFADKYACYCCSPYNDFEDKVIIEEF